MIHTELNFLNEFPIFSELALFMTVLLSIICSGFFKSGLTHQEFMNWLITKCSFSAVIFQERIFNKKYMSLNGQDALSPEEASQKAKLINDMLQME